MKLIPYKEGKRRRTVKVIEESAHTGIGWSKDTATQGGESYSISSFHEGPTGVHWRVELSADEMKRLVRYYNEEHHETLPI